MRTPQQFSTYKTLHSSCLLIVDDRPTPVRQRSVRRMEERCACASAASHLRSSYCLDGSAPVSDDSKGGYVNGVQQPNCMLLSFCNLSSLFLNLHIPFIFLFSTLPLVDMRVCLFPLVYMFACVSVDVLKRSRDSMLHITAPLIGRRLK